MSKNLRSKGESEINDLKYEMMNMRKSKHRTRIEAFHVKVKKRRTANKAASKARKINW